MSKISALPELTTPANDDELEIVDKSDLSQAASGTNKRIQKSNLVTTADDSVTNAKLANMATQTIKGRTTTGTGDPEDLTAAQATAVLNAVVGDSGAGGTKGLVPAPAAGDTAAGKFLKASGTWEDPGAGGGGSPGGADGDYQYRIDASTFGGGSLKRIDADITEIKNSTTAQTFRVYKTTTDNVRLRISNVSSKWEIASESDATAEALDILIGTSRFAFSALSLVPPSNGGQELGTTTIRWGQINGSVVNLPSSGEYRFHALTRLLAGVDGFPIIVADGGIGSNCGWIFGRNDANGVRLRRVSTVLETRLGADSDYAVHAAAGFRGAERSADPSAADLTSGANAKDRVQMYMKNDKLVFAYNDGAGVVNYLAIPLDGSTTTWTNGTSAP